MPELSDCEIVATKLLGWRIAEYADSLVVRFEHMSGASIYFRDGRFDGGHTIFWPDFTDERLQHYWIRRMEDALAERGMSRFYAEELVTEFNDTRSVLDLNTFDCVAMPLLLATNAQRIAAAIRCIHEAGL